MFKKGLITKIKNRTKSFNAIFWCIAFSFKHIPFYTALNISFVILGYLPNYAFPYINSKIIDSLINSINIKILSEDTMFWLLAIAGFYLVSSVITKMDRYSFIIYRGQMEWVTKSVLSKKISSLDFSFFEDSKTSKLIEKVKQNDYKLMVASSEAVELLGGLASLLVSIVLVYRISPLIFWVLLISYVPYLIAELKLGKTSWGIWDTKGDSKLHVTSIEEYLINERDILEVRTFGLRDHLVSLFEKYYKSFLSEQILVEKKRVIVRALFDLLGTFSFMYGYYVILQKAIIGEITIGETTFYIAILTQLWRSLVSAFKSAISLYEDGLFINDFSDVLDLKNKIVSGNEIIDTNKPLTIEFKNIWFKYPGASKYLFEDFNLTLKANEKLAIVGENGAGKSTLIKLLLRFYDPDKGVILVNNKDIKEYNIENYYKQFALLSQEFVRYHFDVKANIGFGDISNIDKDDEIKKSAILTGANKFIESLDNKYDQILDKRFETGTNLSTGQWQKIALARAFFKKSRALILDEPTSAIDPKSEYEIFERLFDYAKDKLVLIVSHRFSTVRNANRIIVMEDGRIIQDGDHKELISKGGIYKEAYDLQKKGYEDI